MPIIEERNVIKRIPIYVKKGRNKGHQVGTLYFEKNKEPYYLVIKNFKSSQMMRHPKHIGELPVSITILNDLKQHGCKNIIFWIINYDEHSFYIVVPLSDYDDANGYEYDDPQKYVRMEDYPRIYPEQGSLTKFITL